MKSSKPITLPSLIKTLASIKITSVCLFLLFVLTFWGTVAQIHEGLYGAQERYFSSFVFLVFGWLPFPGAQGVLWVLFINLLCVTITRFVHYFKPKLAGILIIHFGLLLYFVAAFVTFHVTVESNVHLAEKAGTNLSSSYHQWELSLWTKDGERRHVTAFDADGLKPGRVIRLADGVDLLVKQFYLNAEAFTSRDAGRVRNDSGIATLRPQEMSKEREKNIAGGVFELKTNDLTQDILLYGLDSDPIDFKAGDQHYHLILRHKKYPLPLTIELVDFRAEFHPGTETAKSYESTVRISHDGSSREVVISMNNPLRYRDYTFYQASYAIDASGGEYSTFAVVKNSGRLLPYIASLLTFAGLALHFLMMALGPRAKKERA